MNYKTICLNWLENLIPKLSAKINKHNGIQRIQNFVSTKQFDVQLLALYLKKILLTKLNDYFGSLNKHALIYLYKLQICC